MTTRSIWPNFLGERGYTSALIGGYHEHRWDDVERLGYQIYDPSKYGEDKEGGYRPAAVVDYFPTIVEALGFDIPERSYKIFFEHADESLRRIAENWKRK